MEEILRAYKYNAEKHQLYLENYFQHFKCMATQHINLLEIGVYKGGSLLLWKDFFENGKIVGLDIEPVTIDDPTSRIRIYQGDQRDLALLDRIAAECAPDGFDIIIDDASHIAEFTKISFWHLFDNYLKPGGYYVIEDWRVGYWKRWPDGAEYKWSSPERARSRWFSQSLAHTSLFLRHNDRIGGFAKQLVGAFGIDAIKKPVQRLYHIFNTNPARRLYRRFKYTLRFPSHDYGMVGLIKQLIDELGMDAITNPARDGPAPQQFPKFQRMEVCPGQVFIVKATEKDHHLLTESLKHAMK
jgi:SAM-dependent methyltransferase